jgi:pyruvate carboxylase
MAGLLKPLAAKTLISTLKSELKIPITFILTILPETE